MTLKRDMEAHLRALVNQLQRIEVLEVWMREAKEAEFRKKMEPVFEQHRQAPARNYRGSKVVPFTAKCPLCNEVVHYVVPHGDAARTKRVAMNLHYFVVHIQSNMHSGWTMSPGVPDFTKQVDAMFFGDISLSYEECARLFFYASEMKLADAFADFRTYEPMRDRVEDRAFVRGWIAGLGVTK